MPTGVATSDRLTFVCETQPVLLGDDLSRLRLARLRSGEPTGPAVRVAVNRSLPFEFVANTATRVAETWNARLEFDYSGYDPGLATALGGPRDVTVCWIDWRFQQLALTPQDAARWALERAVACRAADEPVLVNNWPEGLAAADRISAGPHAPRSWVRRFNLALEEALDPVGGLRVLDLAELAATVGATFFDERNDLISSYPFSAAASARIGQHLGSALLPAVLRPRRKAVVVDLDNTLYSGVLGEDGAGGVTITEGHRALAQGLAALQGSGLLLGICSKNDPADVEEFFKLRATELGLDLTEFSAVRAEWTPKPVTVRAIAEQLHIATEALVFLDDNPTELAQVAEQLPDVGLVHATDDGYGSWRQLSRFPGLYALDADDAAVLRAGDIAADAHRAGLRIDSVDEDAYLAALGMKVTFALNDPADVARVHQLSNKTSQFNLALKRLSEQQAEAAMSAPRRTLTVRLSDVFSDSGLVGALTASQDGSHAVVEEVLLSCRVLGRRVEDVALLALLEQLAATGVATVSFDVAEGPRNAPARDWLTTLSADVDGAAADELITILRRKTEGYPMEVTWR